MFLKIYKFLFSFKLDLVKLFLITIIILYLIGYITKKNHLNHKLHGYLLCIYYLFYFFYLLIII
ncbi:hypothetical protein HanRHA438_Chr04g0192201 [Helianthus annuus]|nr:hypothetical protein HanRHA438_Chr04g0192201 [Helianthus annuus]